MDIIIVMAIGIIIGNFIKNKNFKIINEKIQLIATIILIFAMGINIGSKENFINELANLGITSFIFFIIPTILSIIVVYFLTKRFMTNKERKDSQW